MGYLNTLDGTGGESFNGLATDGTDLLKDFEYETVVRVVNELNQIWEIDPDKTLEHLVDKMNLNHNM